MLDLEAPVLCCSAFTAQASAVMHLPAAIGTYGPCTRGAQWATTPGGCRGPAACRWGQQGGVLGASPCAPRTQASPKARALAGWLPAAGICSRRWSPSQQVALSARLQDVLPAHL